MEQINSILKSHGYQNLDYGICGRGGESAGGLMTALIVLKKEFEEKECYCDYAAAGKCVC